MVIAGGLRITGIGVLAGLSVAAVLTRWMGSLLFGVKPDDPLTLMSASASLGLVALIACAAPAIRAARVDPAVALRQE
jgi:ABC-type antimicrobial peptide transport system permease subunit